MERLTKNACGIAHGAEGISESRLTGNWCRGEFEATALVERLYAIENILGGDYDLNRLRELVEADKAGRCVVLPFPLHRMLLNTSDPYNPELMKDFRISATWTHCGIVFHSPWDIFLQNIEKGYIRLMREEAEAMLEGGTPDAEAD